VDYHAGRNDRQGEGRAQAGDEGVPQPAKDDLDALVAFLAARRNSTFTCFRRPYVAVLFTDTDDSLRRPGPVGQPAYAQADGAKVYAAQKCSMCHSIAGVGNKKLRSKASAPS